MLLVLDNALMFSEFHDLQSVAEQLVNINMR